MIAIKTNIKEIPKYCDDCRWYGSKPHPMKGWSDICELMNQCLDDDQEEGWIYDGNDRPKNCPLMEVKDDVDIKKQIGKRLCEIIARNVITNESLGEDEDVKAYNQGLKVTIEIIKDYCEVDKDEISN